jgi:ATP-dependent Clp endopeptidase proteolytic subunit ClpP
MLGNIGNINIRPFLDTAMKALDGGGTPKLTVETMDNHVYFYADVDTDRCLAMIRTVRDIDAYLRSQQITRRTEDLPPTPIWLHIQSGGGDLFAGFATADQLMSIKSPIYSVVEGVCASAATLLSLACTKRYILPNAFMLVHQLSSAMWGTHEQFEDEHKLQNALMDKLATFYSERTGIDEQKVREMMTRDFWMSAEESIRLGFAQEVLR